MKTEIVRFDTPKGEITHITLTNTHGASAVLSNLGAGIVEINVPDKSGDLANVALGYANPEDYFYDGPCMGKTPGRFANRIGHGRFSLDGIEHRLAVNCGPHHLHGGPEGFQNKLWNHTINDDGSVTFRHHSPDGEEGYPGTLDAEVRYTWTDGNSLRIDYKAVTDKGTVINLTNHTYWNMDGESSGSVLKHRLQLNSLKYLETDSTLCPTGKFIDVTDTPMDFTGNKEIGFDIEADFEPLKHGKGYDHCFLINAQGGEEISLAAILSGISGRKLKVFSSLPGIQLYTANWLTDSAPRGRSGTKYHDYDAVALECQMLPDSPNRPEFPSAVLRAGQEWIHTIIYQFLAD